MGGDFAPLEAVKGAAAYLNNQTNNIHAVLIGDEASILLHLQQYPIPSETYSIVPTPQVIEMHEQPTKA